MKASPDLLDFIDERCQRLREELREAAAFGVNTPGFNQTLGALDELKMLLDAIAEQTRGVLMPKPHSYDSPQKVRR